MFNRLWWSSSTPSKNNLQQQCKADQFSWKPWTWQQETLLTGSKSSRDGCKCIMLYSYVGYWMNVISFASACCGCQGHCQVHHLCYGPTSLSWPTIDLFPVDGKKKINVLVIGLSGFYLFWPIITWPTCYMWSLLNIFYSQILPLHFFFFYWKIHLKRKRKKSCSPSSCRTYSEQPQTRSSLLLLLSVLAGDGQVLGKLLVKWVN